MAWKIKQFDFLVIGLIALGLALPIGVYWLALGRIPTLMPAEALQILNQQPDQAVLVDVRTPAEFALSHIEGGFNWPLEQINSSSAVSDGLAGKTLLIICDSGWQSALAVPALQKLTSSKVFNIRGGMQEWPKAAWRVPALRFSRMVSAGSAASIPMQAMTPGEQAAQVLAGFVIKPLYMAINLALLFFLFKATAPDLTALRNGLIAFFVGELFCYINFFAFGDDSYLSEFVHSYGMVVSFGFVFYALLEGIDSRLLRYNNPVVRCSALALCQACYKYSPAACRVRRMSQLLIPVLGILAAIPLLARFNFEGYTGLVFGFQYYYARFAIFQAYDDRLLPILAMLCFAAACVPLWLKKERLALPHLTQIFLAAGLGGLCFSLIRLSLGAIYAADLVWLTVWEEVTELIFVLAIGAVLYLFRKSLFAIKPLAA